MKNVFKQIPDPLQRQILHKLTCGAVALFISIVFLFSVPDMLSIISCVAIMLFFVISSLFLFRRAVIGDYVVINGECQSVARTLTRRRIKKIILRTDDNQVFQVMIKQRLKKVRDGSRVTLYVAGNMPVYEKDNAHFLYSYLAIELTEN